MTDRKENLGLRLGAVILATITLAAVIFSIINFQQRLLFDAPDDGISWLDDSQGVHALYVAQNSPGQHAGVKPGDRLIAINGVPVHRAVDATKRLWSLGAWSQVHYQLERNGRHF